MIVSIGTGCFFEEKKEFLEPALGWDGIINQVKSARGHLPACRLGACLHGASIVPNRARKHIRPRVRV